MHLTTSDAAAAAILDLPEDNIAPLISDLIRDKQFSRLVSLLNADVLDPSGSNRDRAISALQRLGLWFD